MTEKHSERGKVAKMSRNEKRVRMKAQMPGPPGSAVNEIKIKKRTKKKRPALRINSFSSCNN